MKCILASNTQSLNMPAEYDDIRERARCSAFPSDNSRSVRGVMLPVD